MLRILQGKFLGLRGDNMMTIQNAIDYFEDYIEFCENDENGAPTLEPFKIAVKSMKGDVEKMPIVKNKEGYNSLSHCAVVNCPACNKRLRTKWKERFCSGCGQALNWEELEE